MKELHKDDKEINHIGFVYRVKIQKIVQYSMLFQELFSKILIKKEKQIKIY